MLLHFSTSPFSLALVLLCLRCSASTTNTFVADEDYYDSVYDEEKGDEEATGSEVEGPNILPEASSSYSPSSPCNCTCGLANHKSRIVGGEVAQPNEFPWLAAMIRERRLYCAASLISEDHLLTAAHCLRGFDKSEIVVALGGHDRKYFQRGKDEGIEVRRIEKMVLHPKFDPLTYDNDIAVITMDKPVAFAHNIKPICLPFREGGNYTGSSAVVVGWGRTAETKPTSQLPMKVNVVVMSKELCDKSGYGSKRLTDNMICAGYLAGRKDSCQGDSGGPLHAYNKGGSTELIGVVSWGRGCARRNFPGVYTKITNYLDFIHKNIQPRCLCSHS